MKVIAALTETAAIQAFLNAVGLPSRAPPIAPAHLDRQLEDVRAALKRQGMSEEDIEPGDALLFRYGWSEHWTDEDKYNTNPPGIGMEVAAWLVEQQPSMIGSDQWTTEVTPNPDSTQVFPVHQELITKNGIWNLENMVYDSLIEDEVYEFLFVFTPIRFAGATGSPARPIAIR